MVSKKICMLGAFSVGKTSLIKRFVYSIFNEEYQTTIGVQISKKEVNVNNESVKLMIWDIEGADDFSNIREHYLKGAAGCFLVIDGTRATTVKKVWELNQLMVEQLGSKVPFVLIINKLDLKNKWNLDTVELEKWRAMDWLIIETSAKTGAGVEDAFKALTEKIMSRP